MFKFIVIFFVNGYWKSLWFLNIWTLLTMYLSLSAQVTPEGRPDFSKVLKNFQYSHFLCHIWIQHKRCIQMCINKLSIGSVLHFISLHYGLETVIYKLWPAMLWKTKAPLGLKTPCQPLLGFLNGLVGYKCCQPTIVCSAILSAIVFKFFVCLVFS